MKHELALSPTLCAVELDVDDELELRLPDGRRRSLVLRSATSYVHRRGPVGYADKQGVIAYHITCQFELDGRPAHLVRTIPSQENFRDPPVFDGLRIWLDATQGIDGFLEPHGADKPLPRKACRLAIWDASQRICPPLVHPWCPLPEGTLRLEQCYRGEDVWLGPYDGAEYHGGLDINHPAGTPLWTPLSIHEHRMFDRKNVNAGNNRWRGLHHWPDGKSWFFQTHHVFDLRVPEHEPIEAGVHYADAAGMANGEHEHTHFIFGVRENDEDTPLDPWLLFWQMYQDRKATTLTQPWGVL